MGINAQIISEMEMPEDYIESLPRVSKTEYVRNDFETNLHSKFKFCLWFYRMEG